MIIIVSIYLLTVLLSILLFRKVIQKVEYAPVGFALFVSLIPIINLPSAIIIFLSEVGDIDVWLKRYIFFIKD